MRNLIKVLFLSVIMVIVTLGCEEENIVEGNFTTIDIKKITDFGCDDCYLLIKPEYSNDSYYVINSESDFSKYVIGENIPTINFEKYFLIIGVKPFSSGAKIIEERAEENNIRIVYYVSFITDDSTVALKLHYHAFIENPAEDKEVSVEILINN